MANTKLSSASNRIEPDSQSLKSSQQSSLDATRTGSSKEPDRPFGVAANSTSPPINLREHTAGGCLNPAGDDSICFSFSQNTSSEGPITRENFPS